VGEEKNYVSRVTCHASLNRKIFMTKLLSWNVNGLRSVIKKGIFHPFVEKHKPDTLCLQETKAFPEQVQLELPGYYPFWNSAEKKGYSGTLILSKIKPMAVSYGLGMADHDREGRVITAEYDDYFFVGVYTPNSKRGLERLPYRQVWDADFLKYLKKLEKKKLVIFCGDLNVAHKEMDLAHPDTNHQTHGFTDEERAGFTNFVTHGFVDSFREFVPDGGHYTWWNPVTFSRAKNVGWRIDYFLISKALRPRLKEAFILPEVMGSDHCPVGIVIK